MAADFLVCPYPECGRELKRKEGMTRHVALHEATEKFCKRCQTSKPLSAFRKLTHNAQKGHYRSMCRECDAEYAKRYQAEIRTDEGFYDEHLRRTFGITVDQYNAILASQGGVCAICSQEETTLRKNHAKPRRLAVDHDHQTGLVRGLLCHNCNVALGMLADSEEVLIAAIEYLRRPRLAIQKAG